MCGPIKDLEPIKNRVKIKKRGIYVCCWDSKMYFFPGLVDEGVSTLFTGQAGTLSTLSRKNQWQM